MKIRNSNINLLKDRTERMCIALVSILVKKGYTSIPYTSYKGKQGKKNSNKYNVSGRNYKKISTIIQSSYNAARKWTDNCITKGYIEDTGDKLLIHSVSSKHDDRCFKICEDLKDNELALTLVEKELSYFIITNPIRKKQHIKDLLQQREQVKDIKTLKKIDSRLKAYGVDSKEYKDTGITLNKLASESGMAKSTVVRYIKYGQKKNRLEVRRNVISAYTQGNKSAVESDKIDCQLLGGYTFGYVNKGVTVLIRMFANTYCIPHAGDDAPSRNHLTTTYRNRIAYC